MTGRSQSHITWLFTFFLGAAFPRLSQAEGWMNDWDTSSAFECPVGYIDRTNGEARYWACAEGCPGGPFADATCKCACADPRELTTTLSTTTRVATTTTIAAASTTKGATRMTTSPSARSLPTPPVSGRQRASKGDSTTARSSATSISSVFHTVSTTLPPSRPIKHFRGASDVAPASKAVEKNSVPGVVIFVIILSSIVIIGTFVLSAVACYFGYKNPKRHVHVTPVINKTNLACSQTAPTNTMANSLANAELSQPRRAWEPPALVRAPEKADTCPSNASTRQPSPTPSEMSSPFSAVASTATGAVTPFSADYSTATSAVTMSASTPPLDGLHQFALRTAQPPVLDWQPPGSPDRIDHLPAAGQHLPALQIASVGGQVGSTVAQQVNRGSQRSKRSNMHHSRRRSNQHSDLRSAQHSDLRNQRIDLRSVHVSPPCLHSVMQPSSTIQPPADTNGSEGCTDTQ